jgi:hypothetical protein
MFPLAQTGNEFGLMEMLRIADFAAIARSPYAQNNHYSWLEEDRT